MQTIFAWLLVLVLLIAPYPTAAVLVRRAESRWLPVLLALALAVGALSLIMFWESVLGIDYTVAGIALPYVALRLPGATRWWRERGASRRRAFALPRSWQARIALLILTLVAAAVLFNAVYWPFYRDDTLGIYRPQAVEMYALRSLIPLTGADSLYLTYPAQMPLWYAFTYLVSGWENDYLARLVPALLSLGALPAAYLLGRLIEGKKAGWLGALILALTPTFGRWASSGYVDLPMAFFYTLGALFALRTWRDGRLTDAALAGMLVGLAAWTKNAGLICVSLLAAWLAWCWLRGRIGWRQAAISLCACAAVAAPWYVRNLSGAGFIIPATAWTDQAQRTLTSLFALVTRPENFGIPGWLIVASIALSIAGVFRRKLNAPGLLLILLWTLPFFTAWWLFVSYDPRFLLLFLPPLCALAGVWVARLWDRVPLTWQPTLAIGLAALAFVLALQIAYFSIDYKDDILRDPLMGDAQKRIVVAGD